MFLNGGWESLLFHGVGGDWITFDLEEHGRMLDDLEARAKAGRLWVGSAIDVHKYATERDAAKLQVLKASEDGYDVLLPGLDPAKEGNLPLLYDCPLTIVCDAPAGWTEARVRCERNAASVSPDPLEVPVKDGRIVERGVHAELVKAGGVYTELYETQFKKALEAEGQA